MAIPSQAEVTLSHGQTRYLESGHGQPVILLHGVAVAGGADDWRPALEQLGDSYRFLAPDLLNFPPGASFAKADAFPYLTDFIREFQDALGLKSSHIVGATMGGWIAGLFGYESPERVGKLVMTGNPGFHGAANARLLAFKPPDEDEIRAAVAMVSPMLGEDEREALVRAKVRRLAEPGFVEAHRAMMSTMGDPEKRARFNLRRRLPSMQMPILFLLGRGDPTSGIAEELVNLAPRSTAVVIEEGAHQIHYDNAPEFAVRILEFLGGVA
jgi:pimeloyl-ACP methyl ester carboxylesterase